MVARDLWVAIEEPFAHAKDVKAAEEDDAEEKTENDPKREHGIAVLVDDSKDRVRDHTSLDRRRPDAWLRGEAAHMLLPLHFSFCRTTPKNDTPGMAASGRIRPDFLISTLVPV